MSAKFRLIISPLLLGIALLDIANARTSWATAASASASADMGRAGRPNGSMRSQADQPTLAEEEKRARSTGADTVVGAVAAPMDHYAAIEE